MSFLNFALIHHYDVCYFSCGNLRVHNMKVRPLLLRLGAALPICRWHSPQGYFSYCLSFFIWIYIWEASIISCCNMFARKVREWPTQKLLLVGWQFSGSTVVNSCIIFIIVKFKESSIGVVCISYMWFTCSGWLPYLQHTPLLYKASMPPPHTSLSGY